MGMRITTNMTMSTYRYNLMQSTNRWANAQNKVLTHRNFNSYAEDPAAATHAWRIRRSITETGTHYDNNNDTLARFRIAYSAMEGIKTGIARNATAAEGIDPKELAKAFDAKLAKTTPERAATIILEAVRKGHARVLVGPDAKLLDLIIRATGSGAYQDLFSRVTSRVMPSRSR